MAQGPGAGAAALKNWEAQGRTNAVLAGSVRALEGRLEELAEALRRSEGGAAAGEGEGARVEGAGARGGTDMPGGDGGGRGGGGRGGAGKVAPKGGEEGRSERRRRRRQGQRWAEGAFRRGLLRGLGVLQTLVSVAFGVLLGLEEGSRERLANGGLLAASAFVSGVLGVAAVTPGPDSGLISGFLSLQLWVGPFAVNSLLEHLTAVEKRSDFCELGAVPPELSDQLCSGMAKSRLTLGLAYCCLVAVGAVVGSFLGLLEREAGTKAQLRRLEESLNETRDAYFQAATFGNNAPQKATSKFTALSSASVFKKLLDKPAA